MVGSPVCAPGLVILREHLALQSRLKQQQHQSQVCRSRQEGLKAPCTEPVAVGSSVLHRVGSLTPKPGGRERSLTKLEKLVEMSESPGKWSTAGVRTRTAVPLCGKSSQRPPASSSLAVESRRAPGSSPSATRFVGKTRSTVCFVSFYSTFLPRGSKVVNSRLY